METKQPSKVPLACPCEASYSTLPLALFFFQKKPCPGELQSYFGRFLLPLCQQYLDVLKNIFRFLYPFPAVTFLMSVPVTVERRQDGLD